MPTPKKSKLRKNLEDFQLVDFHDLAQTLTESYNGYASMSDDMPMLDQEWVLGKLESAFENEDLNTFLEDEFGRGLLMGQLRVLWEMEAIVEESGEE